MYSKIILKIERIILISHTHTDIGYTDHQDTVFRQHLEFIDQAIELGEATADNHWDTNFKASQGEDTLLRYRLTSTSQYNPVESSGFAIEQTVPPVIVRVPHAEIDTKGTFMNISPKRGCEVHLKKAMDRQGLIIHAYKLGESIQTLYASFPSIQIAEAYSCSPTEDDLEAIDVVNNTVSFDVPSRSVAFVRVVVNPIS